MKVPRVFGSHLAIDRCPRRMAGEVFRPYRYLPPSIAATRHLLQVNLTVKLARADKMLAVFRCLQVPLAEATRAFLGVLDRHTLADLMALGDCRN